VLDEFVEDMVEHGTGERCPDVELLYAALRVPQHDGIEECLIFTEPDRFERSREMCFFARRCHNQNFRKSVKMYFTKITSLVAQIVSCGSLFVKLVWMRNVSLPLTFFEKVRCVMTNKTTTAGLPLEQEVFTAPPLHIPNAAGEPYKTELVVVRTLEHTIKWNFWYLPDDDRDPHNHPWDFEATVHHGGYTERRWWLEDGQLKTSVHTYRAGDVNRLPKQVFHMVIEVLPGTVTRMVCGSASDPEWGYLDTKTGVYRPAEPDPSFKDRLRALNRFLIPTEDREL